MATKLGVAAFDPGMATRTDYTNAVVLAAGTAQQVTVPAGMARQVTNISADGAVIIICY